MAAVAREAGRMVDLAQPLFHLSIPATDPVRSAVFYEALGGRTGRVADDWRDVWVFGGQVTLFEAPAAASLAAAAGRLHFGATLEQGAWTRTVEAARAAGLEFVRGPLTEGTGAKAQSKAYLRDPDGWIVELKSYADAAAALERPAA